MVLTGTNLTGATGVNLGSFAASTFAANSPTQITVTAPNSDIPEFSSLTVDVQMTTPAGTSGLNPPSDGYRYEIPVPIPVHPGQPSPCARCPGGLHPSLQLSTSGKRSPCSQGTNDRPAHVGPVVVPGLAQLVGPGAGASEQGAQV